MDLEQMAEFKRAAKTALDVQDGCNLSGVVASFNRILKEVIWPIARADGHGTDWVNEHPICQAFADKIASLTATQNDSNAVFAAFTACEELVKPEPVTSAS